MAALTEAQRARLEAFRREKKQKRIWTMRRKLLLVLALVGVSVSYYSIASGVEPCYKEARTCLDLLTQRP